MSTIHVYITFIKLSIISLLIGPAVKCLMTERKNALVFVVRYHSLSLEESHYLFLQEQEIQVYLCFFLSEQSKQDGGESTAISKKCC